MLVLKLLKDNVDLYNLGKKPRNKGYNSPDYIPVGPVEINLDYIDRVSTLVYKGELILLTTEEKHKLNKGIKEARSLYEQKQTAKREYEKQMLCLEAIEDLCKPVIKLPKGGSAVHTPNKGSGANTNHLKKLKEKV